MNNKISFLKIQVLLFLFLLFPLFLFAYDLQVHFIDVGHGDCILIKTPDDGIKGNGEYEGETILIDGGEKVEGMRVIIPYLKKN